jgi:ATP-dependent RNA helicase DeaD
MADAPQRQAPAEERSHTPRRESQDIDHRERRDDRPRDKSEFKPRGKPHGERAPKFDDAPSFGKKKQHKNKPGHAEPAVTQWPGKGSPGKKAKKKHRG